MQGKGLYIIYVVQGGERALSPYVNSENPDECAYHAVSIMQSDLDILCSLTYTTVSIDSVSNNAGPDQPAQMCRLIRTCIVCKLHKGPFCALYLYEKQRLRSACKLAVLSGPSLFVLAPADDKLIICYIMQEKGQYVIHEKQGPRSASKLAQFD